MKFFSQNWKATLRPAGGAGGGMSEKAHGYVGCPGAASPCTWAALQVHRGHAGQRTAEMPEAGGLGMGLQVGPWNLLTDEK